MSGPSSPSSSRTLFHELDRDGNDHERYRDALADTDDVEASLDSLEETELGLLHDGKRAASPQYSEEKRRNFSPEARRKSNNRCYAIIAAILLLCVALAFFATMRLLQSRGAPPTAVTPDPSDGVSAPDEAVKDTAPAFPPQVLGPPTDSFWG